MRHTKNKSHQLKLQQINYIQNNDMNELKNVWRKANIQESHQAIILEYLNVLPDSLLDEEIAYQIKLTKNNSSFLCSIKNLERNRLSILQHLCSQINLFEQSKVKNQKNFTLIFETLARLRAANLIFAQALLNIHKYYIQKIPESHAYIQLAPYFEAFHNDNNKLKRSFLRKYIVFSNSYDPFLLKHYQLLKKSDNPRLKDKPAVQTLFSIALNDVYRLTRAQDQIKDYLNNNVNNEDFLSIVNKFEKTMTPALRMSDRIITEPIRNQKLVNKIYLRNSNLKNDNLSPLSNKNTTDQQTNFSYVSPKLKTFQDVSYIGKGNRFPSINKNDSKNKYNIQKPISSIETNDYFKDTVLSRRRSYHEKVDLVEKRQLQFKKMIFPKQFSAKIKNSESPDYWRNERNRKNTYAPNDRIEVTKNFFSERGDSNSSSSSQKKNVHTQCQQTPIKEQMYAPKVLKKIIQASKLSNKQQESRKDKNQEIAVQADIQEPYVIEEPQPEKETTMKRRKSSFKKQEAPPVKNKQIQEKPNPPKPASTMNKKTINKQKKYKLKAADKAMTIQKIFQVIKQLNINPIYKAHFEVGNWQKAIQNNQYYFHKSFIDDELQAISLCCALPQGDITIKYWGPMTTCDEQLSYFLFTKYLEHLQKQTQLKKIYFNANSIKQLTNNNFTLLRERIFERQRILSQTIAEQQYTYFLSVNFTNIAINKNTPNSNTLIVQEGIKQFEPHKFIIFNYLLIISKLMNPGSFASVASYTSKIKSMNKCNEILLSNYLSPNAYNAAFKTQYLNLLTFKLRTTVFSPYFIADRGYIKIIGEIVYDSDEAFIVCLPMHKYSTKLYFGKGMKNAPQMIEKMREGQKNANIRRVVFSIRMFRKKLRGKIIAINLKQEHCFGDLEISFIWKDYLKGKIVHPMTDCQQVFDDQFYCLLEMEREVMFVFQVLPENFVEM